jgi:alpha-glucosidase
MAGTGSRWWHGATLYQIYVRSFQDTNSDGYGDLPGVTSRLDYLSWLGVDGIWLSPTMPSPDDDWGYDVSDYRDVHPELGTLEDLDRLIVEADRRGMRVLLDLVPNHTSSAHPWFVEAVSDPASPRRSYYVWADPAPGGGPPNNWLDATSAPAWTLDEGSGQYYLHNYLPSQPDLNWWEPAVHEAFREILGFWFDRGVAGFRIDVAHGLYKDAELRDDPPATRPERPHSHFGLAQVYSANRPESHGVFRQWRTIADSYRPPRLLLGETWVADLAAMARFHGRDDELHLTFNIPFLFADFTAEALSGIVEETLFELPEGACPVWAASNHDLSRFPTRWCAGDEDKARLALLVLVTLPGAVVLYNGDEIAMTDVHVPEALRRDPMTPSGLGGEGRDRARTPMVWDPTTSVGFTSDGVRPWLPYGATDRNVADQLDDPASTLRLCRDLIALRRSELAGQPISYKRLPGPDGVWIYRCGDLIVAANFTDSAMTLPEPFHETLLATSPVPDTVSGLQPWAGVIARSPAM